MFGVERFGGSSVLLSGNEGENQDKIMNGLLENMDVLMNLGGVPSPEPRGMSREYVGW